jgi:hypothetical protein
VKLVYVERDPLDHNYFDALKAATHYDQLLPDDLLHQSSKLTKTAVLTPFVVAASVSAGALAFAESPASAPTVPQSITAKYGATCKTKGCVYRRFTWCWY